MNQLVNTIAQQTLAEIEQAGLTKRQRPISSRQGPSVTVAGTDYLNFCANNYLGLSGRQELVDVAKQALEQYGFGLSSVRFICGTQTVHQALEAKLAAWFHKEAAITFSSCWDANEAAFATVLTDQDAIITDELNHASLIDGIRLCKAERHIFKHMDMADLEQHLKDTQSKRLRCVVTDGVFSMDGDVAPLQAICDLADKYNAYVVVDDSHASGFMGATGRGAVEQAGVLERVDLITTTFGKALGGSNGGAIIGSKPLIDLYHQRARTTLFTNSLSPMIAATTMFVLDFIDQHPELREQLWKNTNYFREHMTAAGFTVPASVHPIVPVMIGEGKIASDMAKDMLAEGIYVVGFSFPVVPMGKARIRVQMSALHNQEQLDTLLAAFKKLGKKYKLI
ncbi:MAG: glycine C-acetyltransferase [Candidatus Kerfeldbacteria bacterium]|nr:glycine C-acetyltransferase [Candidatus Kerfeldbacteria bacterium]